MEEGGSEKLSPEEVRQRRLAYFQSLTNKDKPPPVKNDSNTSVKHGQLNNKNLPENTTPTENEQVSVIVQKERQQERSQREADDGEIPGLKLETKQEVQGSNEDGYNEAVERLIQLTKQEMAEKYRVRKNEGLSGELTPVHNSSWNPSQAVVREQSNNEIQQKRTTMSSFRQFQPEPSNDLHVEDIFSEQNNSSRPKQNVTMATSMRESQENDTHLMFQKSVDVNQIDELGLSTHRPDDIHNKEFHSGRSPRALNESMSEELKYALGEKKYQAFLEKSMKDIDALYGDNMKNKSKGDKFDKGVSKDINIRREQYEKVANSLMGQRYSETDLKSQNDSDRITDRLKGEDNPIEGHRPLLNRPKHEPTSIYQNKRGPEIEEGGNSMMRSKSMEDPHILSSRNFAFSADEIYSQAYQSHVKSTPIPVSSSGGIGHGHPNHPPGSTGISGVGHGHMIPQGFQPHPGLYHSHSYEGPVAQHPYNQYPAEYFVPQSPQGYFVPHPYSSTGGHPAMRTPRMMPQSPSQKGDNPMHLYTYMPQQPHYDDSPGRQMSARNIHSMDPQDVYRFKQQHPQLFPHPPEEHSFDPEMKPHPPSTKMSKNPHHFHPSMARMPHPPDSANSMPGPHGDMAAFQDYLHLMPKGIPYPPPPNDMELQAYFQYLGSQGYPIPYQSVMPPESPREDQGLMIPHPPAEKKEGRPVHSHFRRRDREHSLDRSAVKSSQQKEQRDETVKRSSEERSDELNSSQRHIDGIRQYHEQKRQQQENEMLEKQRIFAKESIDRYFSSLEHHSSKHQSNKDFTDKPMEILRESLTDVQTLVNSDVTGVTLNAGGITERMNELGIDLSYLKNKENENSENAYKTKGDNPKTRTVIVCPECGEVNKPYMTWCSECSEVLIGIDPVKVKPKRKGGRGKKGGENNDKNYVIYKNVTFDDPKNVEKEQHFSDNEEEVHETERSRSKLSPSKSEGRDSGRPSSEDLDFNRTEHEIDEICQSLSDPVIKGFIKAYFNKKRQELVKKNDNIDTMETRWEHKSEEDIDYSAGQSKNSYVDTRVFDNYQNDSHHGFRRVDQGINEVQYENGQYDDQDNNEQTENHSFIHPDDNYQFRQDKRLENKEVWLHEDRSPRFDPPMNKKHMPIDIEVFTLEESRQGKISQGEPLVPSLNLANSSDEDDNGVRKDKKPFIPLSMSAESEDWQEFFNNNTNLEVPQEEPIPESPNMNEDEESKPFLARLLDHQPKVSKRPPSANAKNKKSNPNVKSIVRESIDAPVRQRKWARSSTAWNSYNPRELSTKSSINKSRPSSAGNKRPSSGGTRAVTSTSTTNQTTDVPRRSGSLHNLSVPSTNDDVTPGRRKVSQNQRPVSVDLSTRSDESRGKIPSEVPARRQEVSNTEPPLPVRNTDLYLPLNKPEPSLLNKKPEPPLLNKKPEPSLPNRKLEPSSTTKKQDSPKSLPYVIDHRLPAEEIEHVKDLGKVQSTYSMYQEMTPRIQQGKFSAWLCLPDEIMLQIFSFLSHSDLINIALTCKQYYRVALDETLWRYITVKKKHDMEDDTLAHIGHRHPVSLALIQCHGDNITAKGLRELFKECSDSLRELNLCGCSRGALTGDCILLHASVRCHNLTHIDASWCMVTDSGIGAISGSCKRLESLCINGCQNVTDEGLETVIKKHGASLRVLEMFGCFKITPKGMRYLATHCRNLLTLNLGQCYKLKDSCISQLSSSLGRIECLDLRGVKHIKDNCIRYVVKNCPRLKTIVLANCPNISDVSLLEISTYLSDIRVIDFCGCRNITDNSIRALSNNCQNLRNIDISSTGCTSRSVSMLANFCSQRLEEAKLNFLADLTDSVVIKLVKHCKRLKLLHLYGCTCIKDLKKIQELNTDLKVEM